MRRLIALVILAIVLVGFVLFGLSDTAISKDDTAAPENEAADSIGKPSNSSASTTITITMTGVLDDYSS